MSENPRQEDFSQILELIRASEKQLQWVKQRGVSLRQIASCVSTARQVLNKTEKQLNQLHRRTEGGEAPEDRLQRMELLEKDRQRATEIGDGAKAHWRQDIQRTTEALRDASAKLMKAKRKLGSLQTQILLRQLRSLNPQQMVDGADVTTQQWHPDCQHVLTVIDAVKRQVRKEKSWLKVLRRRTEAADDLHESLEKYKDDDLTTIEVALRS